MREFYIEGTRQATVPCYFLVKAEDALEAQRMVYQDKVQPVLIGPPTYVGWDTRITGAVKEIIQ